MSALFITALKGLQLVPNGVGGCFMVTDMLHGKVRDDFTRKLGYPVWFPTSLGACARALLPLSTALRPALCA